MTNRFFAVTLAFLGAAGLTQGQEAPAGAPAAAPDLMTPSAVESPFVPYSGPRYLVWGSAEYILWHVTSSPLTSPLLTTTTKPNDFDANGNNVAASLSSPNTRVLFGANDLSYNYISGGKFALGTWFDFDNTIGVEARGFFLGRQSFERTYNSGPAGLPVIGIPINVAFPVNTPIVAIPGGPNAVVESFPLIAAPGGGTFGGFVGGATITSQTQLWGTEINGVWNFIRLGGCCVDLLAGFRYANLTEDVSLTGATTNLVPAAAFGGVAFLNNFFDGTVISSDSWRTRSQFYGGQLGCKAEYHFGAAFIQVLGQVALGSTNETLQIQGLSTLITTTGRQAQAIGGTLATQNNIGSYSRDQFSVIPELEIKLGYNLTERLRLFAGYNLFYWSSVARAGAQINHTVDVRQIPSIPGYDPTVCNTLPAPTIHSSGFTAQGVNFGFEYRF